MGLVVGGASAFKVAQLASGGQAVALMLGGAEVPGTTTDARQQRLLNVVEEMALASGVPVPPVYVLEEPGINAFAAGYAPGDAVVAVSQGCLDYLTRDELQGVVAHEFSHILNGDMRLNIRLIGLIFGIMALSIIGRILMHHVRPALVVGKKDSRGGLMLLGLGLFVLGLVGAFFGRLIKAAVSRQREYLADASAVQFTRNPDGIGGALKKIGGLAGGVAHRQPPGRRGRPHVLRQRLRRRGLAGLLATHPPLDDRIRRLDPQFDGEYPEVRPVGVDREELEGPRPGPRPADRRAAEVTGAAAGAAAGPGVRRRSGGHGSATSIRKKLATPRRCTPASPTCSGSPPRSRSALAPWSTPSSWTRGRTCGTSS